MKRPSPLTHGKACQQQGQPLRPKPKVHKGRKGAKGREGRSRLEQSTDLTCWSRSEVGWAGGRISWTKLTPRHCTTYLIQRAGRAAMFCAWSPPPMKLKRQPTFKLAWPLMVIYVTGSPGDTLFPLDGPIWPGVNIFKCTDSPAESRLPAHLEATLVGPKACQMPAR